jgi:hypothetical protein
MEPASKPASADGAHAGINPVYIVCSPRPATGKTLLARLIIGFYLAEKRAVRAFDLNPVEPDLAELAPSLTITADLADTRGQVELFDALINDTSAAKVVDVHHTAYNAFFDIAERIAFFQEARGLAMEPVILFAANLHEFAPHAYDALQKRFAETLLVPVQNEAIVRTTRFREIYPTCRAAAIPLRILALPPLAMDIMRGANLSFADVDDKLPMEIPRHLREELRKWTHRAFLEFRELELRLLLEKLRTSLIDIT